MNTPIIRTVAFVYAVVWTILILSVHICVRAGFPEPFTLSTTLVFFCLFPFWAFTVFYLRTRRPLSSEMMREKGLLHSLQYLLGNPPAWLSVIVGISWVYATYHVWLGMSGGMMEPEFINGTYMFNNHGNTTIYSVEEYQTMHRNYVITTTGIFQMFFVFAAGVYAPFSVQKDQ